MADKRFFDKKGPFTLEEVARIADVKVSDTNALGRVMQDVASLDEAGPDDVSWAFIPSVRESLKQTKAGAVIVPEKFLSFVPEGTIALIAVDPHRSYGLLAQAFYPYSITPGISDKAFIDPTAKIGEGCQIDAGAFVGADTVIGSGCHIQANAVVQAGVHMGAGCIIGANAVVSHCDMGNKVYIYPGAMIGQDGFGFAMSPKFGPTKCPQLGRVKIGDDVEIGACTTVDRGAMGDTEIGSGTRIDNLVQVAHNVKLGKCCVIVAQVGIAGSCTFGDFVTVGGQVGFAGHLNIGTGSQVGAQSGVMRDIPAGMTVMGSPAQPKLDWVRQQLLIQKLGEKKQGVPLSWKDKIKLWVLKRSHK